MTAPLNWLTPHLGVYSGHSNTGVIRDGDRMLLIDCGDGNAADAAEGVDTLLFTHHHRDQASGAGRFPGARVIVPAAERQWFEETTAYWNDPVNRWHLYNYHPTLVLTEPLSVDRTLEDGETFTWGPARLTALATPGHTDGSMSYLVEVDGRRFAFTGDLIAGPGQLWNLYNLQKYGALGNDYHGFLGAREELAESLCRVLARQPETLIPAHGTVMPDPPAAVELLRERLDRLYREYAAVNSLRWYFPEQFAAFADDPAMMPLAETAPSPACLRHIGTTWVLVSETGAAFVMDCGGEDVVKTLREWQAAGEIDPVEGLWITHYHDDHVDGVPAFQQAFDCPLIADEHVAEVIAEPLAWRLPCLSPAACRVDRVTRDREQWQWHEFTFTAFHLPGQTLHHGGLLVEGHRRRLFFAGDSFAPSGIDDYCPQNRNFLGAGAGFDRCLALLQELRPDLVFNAHIDVGFTFTAEQLAYMRRNLAGRERACRALSPWPHPNFALDDSWLRCHPYEQSVVPGADAHLSLIVTNHTVVPMSVACRPVLPAAWRQSVPEATAVVHAKSETALLLTIPVPEDAVPGRHVIPLDVRFGPHVLPQATEAILVIT